MLPKKTSGEVFCLYGCFYFALALANLARAALRREAVFFFKRPFFTALSYSDWIFAIVSAVGEALKALRAVLMSFLICWLCAVRFSAWRAAFFADLIIGIKFSSRLINKILTSGNYN